MPVTATVSAITHQTDNFFHIFLDVSMNDAQYSDEAEKLLRAVEACCDRINDESDADIDNQRVGGMVTLTFPNRSQIVINQQKPLHEIWMATKLGGYHYRFLDGQWLDTREAREPSEKREFFENLSHHATLQAQQPLRFSVAE